MGASAVSLVAGETHTCALLAGGKVRCWGDPAFGRLGYANVDIIGDDEAPSSAGDVTLGAAATALSAGEHTCALLDGGELRCWGRAENGQLGYGNMDPIGDDETPASAGDVAVGKKVTQIAAGKAHTCALLADGAVRCWGEGNGGKLGYGNTESIGDDETPSSAGDVDFE